MSRPVFILFFLCIISTVAVAADVPASAEDICPIKMGAELPQITLTTIEGESFDLKAAVSKQPTILIYYRGGWCPFCNMQLGQIEEVYPQLIQLGYQILAVSPDKPSELKKSTETHKLDYTLLSDSKMTGAKALGIAYELQDYMLDALAEHNIDLEEASGGENTNLLPVPAVFILDTKGIIHFTYINPNYKIRLNPEVMVTAAKVVLEEP
ncbi:MAG: AhpC/TSA family protein [Gemmatimonadetes bacterium]|nr:MAG: AhpC/TSA family protein [Gemmatimonadota bacterium]